MKRTFQLLVLIILVLFVIPLGFVHAVPLESFAENPIPYWEDDSLDVGLTWSETEQTVAVAYSELYETGYYEDFSDVTDWVESGFEGADSFTTDGDIATFTCEYDVGGVYDVVYTNVPDVTITAGLRLYFDQDLSLTGSANIENMYIYLYDADDMGGNSAYYPLDRNTAIKAYDLALSDFIGYATLTKIESIKIQLRAAVDKTFDFDIDYFYIIDGLGVLDVSVPVTPQSIQSIEFMGNFSALNSTVRFQMYDNTTASDLWCDVNSTHVTFPNDDYALFTNIARINFSLDEERILFRIYVFAQNMTLINSYADYTGLANKDYIRMTSTAFNGTYELWYLQGDIGYIEEVIDMSDNMFYQIFLSTEIWGWFGPLIIIGVSSIILTNKKLKPLGILFIILEFLIISQYFELVGETPWYWWNIIIMLLGMIICVGQMWSK